MAAAQARGTAQDWHFGPPQAPILVRNAEAVLAHLPTFLGGWPISRIGDAASAGPDRVPDITVERRADGMIRLTARGPGIEETEFTDPMDAANGLAGALVATLITSDAGLVCLHCGAVEIGGALCVILGDSLAGKTSLAIHLAAGGNRLFGDDRLAVTPTGTEGMCLGLAPKVRLPLPDDAGPRFLEFVADHAEVSTSATAYLKLWQDQGASFGERLPLGAVIVLDRRHTPAPELAPLTPAEVTRALIDHCFAPHIPAGALVAALAGIARVVPGYHLRFAQSRAAAALLAAALAGLVNTGHG